MKLIFPYDNNNIYTGTPVELYPDSETGNYMLPPNAADFPPEINGEGMWRPFFDEEKQEWVETADEAYKDSLKKDTAPDSNQLAGLGGQLANEKLARKAAEQAQQSLGRHLASLKLELLNVKGE